MSSPSPITRETVSAAVSSLTKWMHSRSASSKPQLLLDDRDDFVILQLSLKRIPANSRINPYLLSLPHPLFPISNPSISTSVCFIIDDRNPNLPSAASFLEKGKELNLPISDSIGISTLKTDYRPFESRRKLCASYDLFIADKKIIPMLPKMIGKTFFEKKKNPLPVNFSRPGWPEQVKKVLNSTFMYLRSGTCIGIRVGRLCMEEKEIVDNVMQVIDEAVDKVPKKWGNLRSMQIRAVDSVALPIYQALPEIGLKIEIGERDNLDSGEVLNQDDEVEEMSEKLSEKSEEVSEKTEEVGEKVSEKKEKRKKRAKDGEEEKQIKKKKKEENVEEEGLKEKKGKKDKVKKQSVKGEDLKAKQGKKDKLEGQNVKGADKEMKKKKIEGGMVKAKGKEGRRTKIRV